MDQHKGMPIHEINLGQLYCLQASNMSLVKQKVPNFAARTQTSGFPIIWYKTAQTVRSNVFIQTKSYSFN